MADLHQAKSRTGQSVKKGVPRQGEEDSRGERDRNLALDQILQKQIAADWARSEAREETVSCPLLLIGPRVCHRLQQS